jgi:hypothetical protein
MKITITVTEEHIRHGIKRSTANCPVKLAIDEVVRSNVLVRVGNCLIIQELGSVVKAGFYLSPLVEPRLWIARFDNDLPVKPITFEINIPSRFLKFSADDALTAAGTLPQVLRDTVR